MLLPLLMQLTIKDVNVFNIVIHDVLHCFICGLHLLLFYNTI